VDLNRIDGIAHQTPLFYAAKEGHLDMCKLLVEAGSDVFIQDSLHKTAAHYAKVNSRVEVHEYLVSQMYKNKEQRRINAAVKN
jgi:ankyrin repeat protein